jgi:hypothetical protein
VHARWERRTRENSSTKNALERLFLLPPLTLLFQLTYTRAFPSPTFFQSPFPSLKSHPAHLHPLSSFPTVFSHARTSSQVQARELPPELVALVNITELQMATPMHFRLPLPELLRDLRDQDSSGDVVHEKSFVMARCNMCPHTTYYS